MSAATPLGPWTALRLAVRALIAEAVLIPARAFLQAVSEAKAQTVTLLFAPARSLDDAEGPADKPETLRRPQKMGGGRSRRPADNAWRNPHREPRAV
jgi:hypothetical protein